MHVKANIHMKKVNVAIGRFQPFTKGHLQMLKDGYDKNGLPAVVFMIANTKFDKKHPFTDELIAKEMDILKKEYDFVEATFPCKNADMINMGQVLHENGYEAQLWLCGDDREASFKRMCQNERYRKEGFYPDNFTTYTGTGRTEGVSGTAVRQTLADDDVAAFKKLMPNGTDKLFKKLREQLMNVSESVSMADLAQFVSYINEAEEDVTEAKKYDVYLNGRRSQCCSEWNWKREPKVGNGCYFGGAVFKIKKVEGDKVYMEEDK